MNLTNRYSEACAEELTAYDRWERIHKRAITAWERYQKARKKTARIERLKAKSETLAEQLAPLVPWPDSTLEK